jgi:DNA-binding transcriptional LysR family regulator
MNSQFGIYEAVKNGLGLAALPDYLYENDKEIKTCFESIKRPSDTMYFVYMESRKDSTRIELLKDFLLNQ